MADALVAAAAPENAVLAPNLLAALPDLSAPSLLSSVLVASIQDPMVTEGVANMDAVRAKWFDAVTTAAAEAGEDLLPDWSNFFKCSAATNALFDLRAIFQEANSIDEIKASATRIYDRLLSAEAESWTLEDACKMHGVLPPKCLWARPLSEVWEFLGQCYSLAPHAVAQCFEDNHMALVRKCFRTVDGEATYPFGRMSLLVAISGGAKSVLMRSVESVLKSDEVSQSFGHAKGAWCKSLAKYEWYSSQGANLEGIIKHAKQSNDPIGLRSIHEEVSQTVARLGQNAKDKLQPSQVISVADPTLATGKRLGGGTSSVQDLKLTVTAAVQGNMCHFFLPFTPEGESFRWEITLSPAAPGLDIPRADKMASKQGSHAFLKKLLALQVTKILGEMGEGGRLELDDDSRGIPAILENAGKAALKRFAQRVQSEEAQADPLYAYLRGKSDSKYMSQLSATCLTGECLLCFCNETYKPKLMSNKVYARMAMWRTLLSEIDRRAVMVNNRRTIEATPYLKMLASGASPEDVEMAQAKKRRRAQDGGNVPQNDEETKAYILQKVVAATAVGSAGEPRVVHPQVILDIAKGDRVIKSRVKIISDVRGVFAELSQDHGLVKAYGMATYRQPDTALVWTELASNGMVPPVRMIGKPGGQPSCPAIQLVAADSPVFMEFTAKMQGIYNLP
jgi:hypothetical protein